MSRRRISSDGLALIKRFEGFHPKAVQLNETAWVIGYGHTRTARAGLKVSRADAEAILREYDLAPIERAVSQSVLSPMSDSEFDALVSFAFSVGLPAFRSSQVLAHMNSGQPLQAADAMHAWRKAHVNGRLIVVDSLVRRRAAEAALMLSGVDIPANAPSQLVHPQFDVTASIEAPREWDEREDPYSREPDLIDHGEDGLFPPPSDDKDLETALLPDEEGKTEPAKAAEIVSKRLVRILERPASEDAQPADQPEETDRAESVDEITKAVSALADTEESINNGDDDDEPAPLILPELDLTDEHSAYDGHEPSSEETDDHRTMFIDDTALDVMPEADADFAEAMLKADEEDRNQKSGRFIRRIYLAGGILGAATSLLGVAGALQVLPSSWMTGLLSSSGSTVLILVGVLVLLICGFYYGKLGQSMDDRPLNQQGFL